QSSRRRRLSFDSDWRFYPYSWMITPMKPTSYFSMLASPLLMASILSLGTLQADDWTFYRGPHLDGSSNETEWKHEWDGDPKVAWRAKVGPGAASFVVKGRQVITTGNVDDKDIVWCFDLDSGKEIWKAELNVKFE